MRKNIVLMVLMSFMFVVGLQVAEPVAAASLKVIDNAYTKFKDGNTWLHTSGQPIKMGKTT